MDVVSSLLLMTSSKKAYLFRVHAFFLAHHCAMEIQWGLKYRMHSELGWPIVVRFQSQPFKNLTFKMAALSKVVLYIIFWFPNGPYHSKTKQNGGHFVFSPFENRTLKHSIFEWIWFSNVRNLSPPCIDSYLRPVDSLTCRKNKEAQRLGIEVDVLYPLS